MANQYDQQRFSEIANGGTPEFRMTPAPDSPILFYDGGCGLCHRGVHFVLQHDRAGRFRFAPLFSPVFERLLTPEQRAGLPDSVALLTTAGELLVKSRAVRSTLRELGGFWKFCGALLALIPRPLADFGYDCIARIRKHIFAKPKTTCPLMRPELRTRFLLD